MKTLALSGWGQPHDALQDVAPDALHLDYAGSHSLDEVFDKLSAHRDAHTLIGWSLGGQIAARAVAEGVVAPERLVLLAAPFRFLQREGKPPGMGMTTFTQYRDNMARDPQRTLKKSYALIAHEDTRGEQLRPLLERARERLPERDWLRWLDTMAAYSFESADFTAFPPTLLVHGDRDAVISRDQSEAFLRHLPQAELMIFEGCGHAPHWHDAPRLLALLAEVICDSRAA